MEWDTTINHGDECCNVQKNSMAKLIHDSTCKVKNCTYEIHLSKGFDLSRYTNWSIEKASAIFADTFKQYVNSLLEII